MAYGRHSLRHLHDHGPQPGTASGLATASGDASLYSAVGNVFFTYDDGVHGTELWATDGSAAGTRLVKDLNAGSAATRFGGIFAFGDKVFFSADVGDGKGAELYASDGTPDGTGLVADLNAARGSDPSGFTAYAGQVYFTANRPNNFNGSTGRSDGGTGAELFVTDGTAAGTHLVVDLAPGQGTATIGAMNAVGGKLVLSYTDNVSSANASGDSHFAVSDGTAAGTVTFTPTSASGGKLGLFGPRAVVGNQLYFNARDVATNTDQLWVTDGTLGATHLVDPAHVIYSSAALGSKLIYQSYDASTGFELFAADGSGAHLVKDLYPGTSFSSSLQRTVPNSSSPILLGSADGLAYFTATDGVHGLELWSTDGTDAGTQLVRDVSPGGFPGVPQGGTLVGGTIVFDGDNSATGEELWASDGTTAGTRLVADINAQLDHKVGLNGPFYLGDTVRRAVSGGLLFEAYTQDRGFEPWISDGTPAGTHQIPTNFDTGLGDSYVTSFRAYGAGVAFVRNNSLWVADDDHFTNAHRVSPSTIGASSSINAIGPSVGETLFFLGYNSQTSTSDSASVYVSTGSADSTHILRTSTGQALAGSLTGLADRVLIAPTRGLFASDGTNAGTTQIGVAGDVYTFGGRIGDQVFYIEQNSTTGIYSVATTDGTATGTQIVAALPFTAPISSSFAVGSTRVLVDNGHLYRTDGTAAGTYQLLAGSSETFTLSLLPTPGETGSTYFVARTGTSPNGALWITDGTDAGTKVLNATLGDAADLTYLNGQLYYTLRTPTLDLGGLYAANADGTNQHLVSDAAKFGAIYAAAGKIFVVGIDDVNGAEFWTTDGTASGTVRLTDTFTNPSSNPANFTRLISAGEFAVAAPGVALTHDTGLSADDAVTADATLTITPAVNGGKLAYVVDGVVVASYDPASLGQGAHSVTVTQTDEAGQVSAPGTISFKLDTVAPRNAISTPSGSTTAGIATVIEGRGPAEDAGGRLDIVEGGTVLATTTVASSGAWSTTVQLGEGAHHLVAILTDVAGNAGSASVDINATAGSTDPTGPTPPRANSAPVAQDDAAVTRTDTALALSAARLLANDTDRDGDALTLIGVGGASHGSVAYDAARGLVTFTPEAGYAGDAGFTYTIADGHGGTAAAAVAITVAAGLPPMIASVSGATNGVTHGLTGTVDPSEAGTAVTIRDGSVVLGTVAAGSDGHFALPFVFDGAGSSHGYALTATDAHGVTSETFAFTLDFTPNRGLFGTLAHDASGPSGQVAELYQGLLGRAPDALGLEAWVDAVGHGTSLASVARDLLASSEYTAAHGPISAESDAGFVSELYGAVLGRPGDAVGTAFWTDVLAHGAARGEIAAAFSLSPENLAQDAGLLGAGVFVPDPGKADVARLYYAVLDRAPDAGGLTFWSSAVAGGLGESAVAQAFLSSSEYATTHGAVPSPETFVTGLYDGALGRAPDSGGLAFWTGALAQGQSRADVALAIDQSLEAKLHHVGDIETGWHLS